MLAALLATAEESSAEEVTNPILPVVPELVWGIISFALLSGVYIGLSVSHDH